MTSSQAYDAARGLLELMDDAEIIALHREVSRIAQTCYARTECYQQNYRAGMAAAAPKIEAWNDRVKAHAAAIARAGETVTPL